MKRRKVVEINQRVFRKIAKRIELIFDQNRPDCRFVGKHDYVGVRPDGTIYLFHTFIR